MSALSEPPFYHSFVHANLANMVSSCSVKGLS